MDFSLILSAFIAGLLTFLAPCTLPLVPGYLGFVSGVSAKDLNDPKKHAGAKRKVLFNGVMYVIGFTIVFMIMGTLFAAAGAALAQYRIWLGRIGGIFVIFFGLYLMHVFELPFFKAMNKERRFRLVHKLTPGKPSSALIFGMTFAFGWTPCVGPVLGTILALAATKATVLQGGILLFIFSMGLALPFLLIAIGIGHAAEYIKKLTKYLNIVSIIGGLFLVGIGVLLVTDSFVLWLSWFYDAFDFLNFEVLLEYL